MISTSTKKRPSPKTGRPYVIPIPVQTRLEEILEELSVAIPPLWPLQDFVAVNPFQGFSHVDFLKVREHFLRGANADLLMPLSYFQKQFLDGEFTVDHLDSALSECQLTYPDHYSHWTTSMAITMLRGASPVKREDKVSDTPDATHSSKSSVDWNEFAVGEISRFCGIHFDQGQALWQSPWKHLGLFEAWLEFFKIDLTAEKAGLKDFRKLVQGLSRDPISVIQSALDELAVARKDHREYLWGKLCTVWGWSSFVKCREQNQESSLNNTIGLLAIRLVYEIAVARNGFAIQEQTITSPSPALSKVEELGRYLFQVACETSYRQKLTDAISQSINTGGQQPLEPPAVQMLFCIDVRSENFRKRLESVSGEIETLGFAGFFGVPMEYIPVGESAGTAQCPVLIKPSMKIKEGIRNASPHSQNILSRKVVAQGRKSKLWKNFQTSAASCFSFVESFGLLSAGKLLRDSAGWTPKNNSVRPDNSTSSENPRIGPSLMSDDCAHSNWELRVQTAEGILRNSGLIDKMSKLIVFCGHECETVNNPYKASLDCGACGGHSGEPNARFAAMLLNDPFVRESLAERGALIPADTVFLSAVHNTTTNRVRICDTDQIPASHQIELMRFRSWLDQAESAFNEDSELVQAITDSWLTPAKNRDWSEVRPEWGLAGNAALIVGPRSATKDVVLRGRAFLHSYDYRKDPDYRTLELIMTAPMIVANWINLQYYASTVDNRFFGSGDKTLHNVVGQLGVLEGNTGDLRTGLPWQSIHNGKEYQHQPLRLTTILFAPRKAIDSILAKHKHVFELVDNQWLTLISVEDRGFHQLSPGQGWMALKTQGGQRSQSFSRESQISEPATEDSGEPQLGFPVFYDLLAPEEHRS